MTNWLLLSGAFCSGLALALWLEARWRRERAAGVVVGPLRKFVWGCVAAAVLCFAGGSYLYLWAVPAPAVANRASPVKLLSRPTLVATAVRSSATRTLSPPKITILEEPSPAATAVPPSATPSRRATLQKQGTAPPVATATATAAPARLRIPDLDVDEPVQMVPLKDGEWDVSQLGSGLGRLATTGQHPDDELAMVFAGHISFPTLLTLQEGAFARLQRLRFGAEVIYEVGDEVYLYRVNAFRRVKPEDVDALYRAGGNAILLVTCTDWDPSGRVYANRLLVQAERVEERETAVDAID